MRCNYSKRHGAPRGIYYINFFNRRITLTVFYLYYPYYERIMTYVHSNYTISHHLAAVAFNGAAVAVAVTACFQRRDLKRISRVTNYTGSSRNENTVYMISVGGIFRGVCGQKGITVLLRDSTVYIYYIIVYKGWAEGHEKYSGKYRSRRLGKYIIMWIHHGRLAASADIIGETLMNRVSMVRCAHFFHPVPSTRIMMPRGCCCNNKSSPFVSKVPSVFIFFSSPRRRRSAYVSNVLYIS